VYGDRTFFPAAFPVLLASTLMPIRAVHRRALTLLAGSPEGLTISLLFYAHSVPIGVLINLINEGLATVQVSKRHGRPGDRGDLTRLEDERSASALRLFRGSQKRRLTAGHIPKANNDAVSTRSGR
jgi:hypothetical protein